MSNKYVIVEVEENHMILGKAIVFDSFFWHDNLAGERKVVSAGFFDVIHDPYDEYGFNVNCGGDPVSMTVPCRSKEDAYIIKKMLRGMR